MAAVSAATLVEDDDEIMGVATLLAKLVFWAGRE